MNTEELYVTETKIRTRAIESLLCEICGKGGFPRKLFGGYHVTLCSTHANAWEKFLTEHEAWDEIIGIEAKLETAVNSDREADAVNYARVLGEAQDACYAYAEQWVKEMKVKWQA